LIRALAILFDPSPIFAALDAVHGHFADLVFFGQAFDGELTVLAGQGLLDGLYLAGGQFQSDGTVSLYLLVGDLGGTFLLMTDHFFQACPFEIFGGIVELVVIYVDHVFVLGCSFRKEETRDLTVDVQRAVIARAMQVERFVAGCQAAVEQFAVGHDILRVTGYATL